MRRTPAPFRTGSGNYLRINLPSRHQTRDGYAQTKVSLWWWVVNDREWAGDLISPKQLLARGGIALAQPDQFLVAQVVHQ